MNLINKKNIFLYWDDKGNSDTPDYILMCRETILKNCGDGVNVILINKNNLLDYLDDVPENLFKLKEIAHIADYVRVALLVKYGGIWLDSDCILLKDLNPIFEKLKKNEYVGYSWQENQPSLGFMASQPNCKLLKKHLKNITNKINLSEDFQFNWSGLGYDSLWVIAPEYKEDMYLFNNKYFSPIHWSRSVKDFLSDDLEETTKDSYCVMLFNKMFSNSSINTMTREEILSQKNLLSNLFKKAL